MALTFSTTLNVQIVLDFVAHDFLSAPPPSSTTTTFAPLENRKYAATHQRPQSIPPQPARTSYLESMDF